MLTLVALGFAFNNPALSVPAGFYTLGELCETLTKQHVPTVVAQNASNDAYAIRAVAIDWDKLRAALQRDGRLSISQTRGGWQIERSLVVKRDESRAKDQYSAYALNSIHALFGGAAKMCAELETGTDEQREAAVTKARIDAGKDRFKLDFAQLLYLYSEEHDMPFMELGFPALVSDPTIGGFGRTLSTNFFEARNQIVPGGDLSKIPITPPNSSPEEKASWARSVHILLKLAWDPVTFNVAYRLAMFDDSRNMYATGSNVIEIVPRRLHTEIPVESAWTPAAIEAVSQRAKATAGVLSIDVCTLAVDAPTRPMRVGEALLRAAEGAKTNLIYYVSPMTDFMLPAGETRSVSKAVSEVNSHHLDHAALNDATAERTGNTFDAMEMPSMRPQATLTATGDDGILVIRNEMRFLDGLCDARTFISTRFENGLLRDKKPVLSEIAAEVMKMAVSSGISGDALDFCNPITFRPFAAALDASPALIKKIEGQDLDKAETYPFGQIEAGAQSAFLSELARCAAVSDATARDQCDPLFTMEIIRKNGLDALQLLVTRTRDSYSFRLRSQNALVWSSLVRHTESEPNPAKEGHPEP